MLAVATNATTQAALNAPQCAHMPSATRVLTPGQRRHMTTKRRGQIFRHTSSRCGQKERSRKRERHVTGANTPARDVQNMQTIPLLWYYACKAETPRHNARCPLTCTCTCTAAFASAPTGKPAAGQARLTTQHVFSNQTINN